MLAMRITPSGPPHRTIGMPELAWPRPPSVASRVQQRPGNSIRLSSGQRKSGTAAVQIGEEARVLSSPNVQASLVAGRANSLCAGA